MEAKKIISDLCQRHRANRFEGSRLLPLVRWALQAPEGMRRGILAEVEEALRQSPRRPIDVEYIQRAADEIILRSIAPALHRWESEKSPLDLREHDGTR